MFVSVGTQKYRVQFVHSGEDLKNRHHNPGGLRQLVDNLALSLHRRVTFAEIAVVEEIKTTKRGPTEQSFVPLGQGFSVCHRIDHFEKKTGRGRALYRALKFAVPKLDAATKDGIAAAAGFSDYTSLRVNYSDAGTPVTTGFSGETSNAAVDPEFVTLLRNLRKLGYELNVADGPVGALPAHAGPTSAFEDEQ